MSTQRRFKKFGAAVLVATAWSLLGASALAGEAYCEDQHITDLPGDLKLNLDLSKLNSPIIVDRNANSALMGSSAEVSCYVRVEPNGKNKRKIVPRVLFSEKNYKHNGEAISFEIKGDKTVQWVRCELNSSSKVYITLGGLKRALSPVAQFPMDIKTVAECDKPIDALQQKKASLDKALAELGSKSDKSKAAQADRESKPASDNRLAERESRPVSTGGRAL